MSKSIGIILNTPLQSWSTAGKTAKHSLLAREIAHAKAKHPRFVFVENTRGLLKTTAFPSAMRALSQSGYAPIVLEAGAKTLIIGQKK